ncbi:BspA family leucine-rich repeat surface protein, partial [Companilactobacillus hulinensis]|uniref:BspA family leucine-rich repeat surface protein n=1 Tax=Companilactobacillus hulinensis TaxID=2486007 RepID=UPI000F78A687
MRFQQLNRDPNTVMRKKLVKSKKNWVVISSLSLAGGLFLLGAPTNIAKADVTADTQAPLTMVQSGTTSGTEDPATVKKSDSDAAPLDKTQDTPNTGDKDTTPAPTTDPVDTTVKTGTEATATSSDADKTAATAADATTGSTTETLDTAALEPAKGTSSKALLASSLMKVAAAPAAGTLAGADTPTDGATADGTTPVDGTATDADATKAVAEDTVVPTTDTGNGWHVVANNDGVNTKTLNIGNTYGNKVLDNGTGVDHERWGGNTANITQINVETPMVAPTDSSYLFANMTNLTKVNGLDKITTGNVDNEIPNNTGNTEGMFKNDEKLTYLDLSSWYLRNVTNLSHMFENDHSLEKIQFGDETFKNIRNASYAFANDEKLTDILGTTANISGTNAWFGDTRNPGDLQGMFKNDISLTSIYITTWNWGVGTNTGDSTKGEGMFDGTDLKEIKLSHSLIFDANTALTSNSGTTWTNADTGKSFSGIPTYTSGQLTDGIAYLYNGNGPINGTATSLLYVASGAAKAGDTVANMVTIHTTLNGDDGSDIVNNISGTFNTTVDAEAPATITVNGITYTLTNDPTVFLEQTQATASPAATYSSAEASDGSVTVSTDKGGTVTIPISGTGHFVGQSSDVDVSDITGVIGLPKGYHIASGTTVNVNFTADTTTPNTSTSTVTLVGDPVDGKSLSVATSEGSTIPLDVQPGKVGDTQTFTITQDVLPAGYHLADNQSKDVTVTLTGDPDNPYS